jgi:hypothetical protein
MAEIVSGSEPAPHQPRVGADAICLRCDYVGSPPPTGGSVGSSPGGYYVWSYPTASTISCANDSAWRELSKSSLMHFAMFAQAKASFPGYHLHQPC